MTKKDYERIAHAMAMAEPAADADEPEYQTAPQTWDNACRKLARALRADNNRFDENRFLEACHYDYWTTHKQPVL